MTEFYATLRTFDAALMILGVALNLTDRRMLLLTLAVSWAVLFPIFKFESPVLFYVQCFGVDLLLTTIALLINAPFASKIVAFLGIVLCGTHLSGAVVGPSDGVSLYRVSVPAFEISQLLTCIVLSDVVIKSLRVVKLLGRT